MSDMLVAGSCDELDRALRRGVAFIIEAQQADGSFAALVSSSPNNFATAAPLPTIFLTSVILTALCSVGEASLEPVQSRTAAFLLTQKSRDWSFNYSRRDSREYREHPYPDDLDDTFCALAALWLYDPKMVDGTVLAAAARLLIATEQKVGGPYRTWLTQAQPGKEWGDVDVAVNANIGWFLSLQGVEVPGVVRLVEQAIRRGTYTSPYYPDDTVTRYLIARWYRGRQTKLFDTLREQLEEVEIDSPLRIALLVSSLMRLDADRDSCVPAIRRLLDVQQPDGSWPAAAFCLDSASGHTVGYAGSPALTTALCLEALVLYKQAVQRVAQPLRVDTTYQRVVTEVQREVDGTPQPDLRRSMKRALQRVLVSGNEEQVVLLPYLIAEAAGVQAPSSVLQQLAAANLWGWAAYTVCDDFLDGEGHKALLPGAVACLHRLQNTLHAALPSNDAFHTEIQHILDRTDAANAWEIAHCRGTLQGDRLYIKRLPNYGNYWQLADRSLGHIIAGLGALYAAGLDGAALQLVALRDFFRHYLIARQLNDDAHDWEDDLQGSHINAAGVLVVKHWLNRTGTVVTDGIPLEAAHEALQSSMWEYAIDVIAQRIFRHTAAARRALIGAGFDTVPFEAMLVPLDSAAHEALNGRQKTRDFLASL